MSEKEPELHVVGYGCITPTVLRRHLGYKLQSLQSWLKQGECHLIRQQDLTLLAAMWGALAEYDLKAKTKFYRKCTGLKW